MSDEPKRRNRRAGGVYYTPETDKDSPKVMLAKRVNRLMLERGLKRTDVTAELNRVRAASTPEYGRHRMHIILTAKHMPEQALIEDLAKVFKVDPSDLIPANARLIDKEPTRQVESAVRMDMLPEGRVRLHVHGQELPESVALHILSLIRQNT